MNKNRLSRRSFLKLAGASAGAAAFSGFSPFAMPRAHAQDLPTVKMWRWGGTSFEVTQDNAVRAAFPEMNNAYNTEVVAIGSSDFSVAEQFRLALAAGPSDDFPDLIMLNRTQVTEFAREGVLADLGDVFSSYGNDLFPSVVNMAQSDGQFVCFPRDLKSKIFMYRADMFEDAGIALEDLNSVSGFIEAGNRLREVFPESSILNMGPQINTYYTHMVLSAYDDPRFAEEDGTYRLTSEPAFAEMFQFWKDIYSSGIAMPIDDWSADWQQAFADEAISGMLIANWMKLFLPGFAPEQAGLWRVAPWPSLGPLADQAYGSEAGGAVFVVPQNAPNREFAIDFAVKQIMEPAGALSIFEATGFTPLLNSTRDQVIDIVTNAEKPADLTDEEWATHPFTFFGPELFEVEFQTYETHKTFPFDPQASAEITIMVDWLRRFMNDESDLEDALSNAEADMEMQIGNPFDI